MKYSLMIIGAAMWAMLTVMILAAPAGAEEPKVTVRPFVEDVNLHVMAARMGVIVNVDEFTGVQMWEYDISDRDLQDALGHEAVILPVVIVSDGVAMLRMDFIRFGEDWLFPQTMRFVVDNEDETWRFWLPLNQFSPYTLAADTEITGDGLLYEWGYYVLSMRDVGKGYALPESLLSMEELQLMRDGDFRVRLDGCAPLNTVVDDVYIPARAWDGVMTVWLEMAKQENQ